MIAVAQWIVDAGTLAGALTAVLAAGTIVLRSRVGRWLLRQIREDVAQARRAEIREVLDEQLPRLLAPVMNELVPNGGSSFRDEFHRFAQQYRADLALTRSLIERNTALIKKEDTDDGTTEPQG